MPSWAHPAREKYGKRIIQKSEKIEVSFLNE
jgi:hypothetical protein